MTMIPMCRLYYRCSKLFPFQYWALARRALYSLHLLGCFNSQIGCKQEKPAAAPFVLLRLELQRWKKAYHTPRPIFHPPLAPFGVIYPLSFTYFCNRHRCPNNGSITFFKTLALCLKIPKKISLLSLFVALLWKPLVIRFCPLKMFSDFFRSFYTVNTQNLKESEIIYKGQKRFTKGFFEINIARKKMRLFW